MHDTCLICSQIDLIKNQGTPDFVAELETGYVVLGWHQFFEGYTIFFCKEHKSELHELDSEFKKKFLLEMSQVAEAVFNAFKPKKLNYELLGNSHSHLHWHLFPRHANDPRPNGPVWKIDESITNAESTKPSPEQLEILKQKLLAELKKTAVVQADLSGS